jgi:hypothetical protein
LKACPTCDAVVQVREIAGDLKMSREAVLYFINWLRSLPEETRESMKDSREAAEEALAERKKLLQQSKPAADPAENLTFQGASSAVIREVAMVAVAWALWREWSSSSILQHVRRSQLAVAN